MTAVTDKVINIIVENFGLNEQAVKTNKDLETLGVDSIITIEIQLDLEREFGIKIPDGVILPSYTVNDISEYIQNKVCHHGRK
ncbi:TPA: acyl carrier protein [Klebsiella oxytoca]|uniref:Acyl carrier protein n=1 Tax=Klebsiella oxytoca TaxID=571 RepID=A0AAN5LET7_KLEOX|nr:acyl carrier protein [Klebsiella oxytoca]